MENVIKQANELGCYLFLLAGGEPMMRKDDILTLCRRHQDCAFMLFTNGTLIDEEFADHMLEVKNLIPAVSIEGYEEDTDFRRGKGNLRKSHQSDADHEGKKADVRHFLLLYAQKRGTDRQRCLL
jgi:MoaA/NifB/PqqE/SkfB family radical SAM enzyme